jgi:hypothetical protein
VRVFGDIFVTRIFVPPQSHNLPADQGGVKTLFLHFAGFLLLPLFATTALLLAFAETFLRRCGIPPLE